MSGSPGFITGRVRRSTSASVPVIDGYDLVNAVYESDCDVYDVWSVCVCVFEREREAIVAPAVFLRASLLIATLNSSCYSRLLYVC